METPRPRTYNGHTFSPNAADNKQYLEKAIKQVVKDIKLIATPAEVRIDAYMEMPTNVPPDEVILYEAGLLRPICLPDVDNLAKCYLDMLTDILTIDDCFFYQMEVQKWYSLEPRVEMRISYQTALDSDYLYHRIKNRKTVKAAIEDGRIELKRL